MRTSALTLTVVLAFAPPAAAQARPDFSGDWVLAQDRSTRTSRGNVVVSVAGLLGDSFTAKQDEKTLALTITVRALNRTISAIYYLNGSESRNLNPVGPGVEDEPIFSRASWDGDKLVIHTRGTTLINGKPIESKRVLWIDAEGLLNIERSSEGQPTTRSVYRRAR